MDENTKLPKIVIFTKIFKEAIWSGLTQANWETRFLVDIYVLKTMIYCQNLVSLRKSWQRTTSFYIFSSTVNYPRTLVRWEQDGKINAIKTPSGQRRYDIDSYIQSYTSNYQKKLFCIVAYPVILKNQT